MITITDAMLVADNGFGNWGAWPTSADVAAALIGGIEAEAVDDTPRTWELIRAIERIPNATMAEMYRRMYA